MAENVYEALVEAKITIDSHESDLYFPVTEQTTAILDKFPEDKKRVKMFVSQIAPHVFWYDLPFAYLPYWDAKRKRL